MHNIGGQILESLINSDNGDYRGTSIEKEDNGYTFIGYRNKKVLTVLGSINLKRSYYYDRKSKEGFCPKDKDLDIENTTFSPGARRIMARVGAYQSFCLGQEDITEMAGIDIDAKEIERYSSKIGEQVSEFDEKKMSMDLTYEKESKERIPIMYVSMDGTGVPVVKKETHGRKGKNGVAKTGEVK